MTLRVNIEGQKFGRLTALHDAGIIKPDHVYGNVYVSAGNLVP